MEYDGGQHLSPLDNRPRVGRSGPRRKTGCLTCRKRKVRCDEGKPRCRRCERLQVFCAYPQVDDRPQITAVSISTLTSSSRGEHEVHQQQPGRRATLPNETSPAHHCAVPRVLTTHEEAERNGVDEEEQGLDGQRFLPQTGVGFDFLSMDPSALFAEFTDGLDGLFSDTGSSHGVPENIDDRPEASAIQLPENFEQAGSSYGMRLKQHFMSLVSPPRLIVSVDDYWKDVRDTILTMADTSIPLSNAIYAFSDAHLSMTEGREPMYAAAYYDQASMEVENNLKEAVDGQELKASFGAIFFLIYVEVSLRSSNQRSKSDISSFLFRFDHLSDHLITIFVQRIPSFVSTNQVFPLGGALADGSLRGLSCSTPKPQ